MVCVNCCRRMQILLFQAVSDRVQVQLSNPDGLYSIQAQPAPYWNYWQPSATNLVTGAQRILLATVMVIRRRMRAILLDKRVDHADASTVGFNPTFDLWSTARLLTTRFVRQLLQHLDYKLEVIVGSFPASPTRSFS